MADNNLASLGINGKFSISTSGLIGAGIMLASEILKLVNTITSRKYCTKLINLKEDLNDELRKPMDQQNDALIEKIQDDIITIQDLAMAELKAYANSNIK